MAEQGSDTGQHRWAPWPRHAPDEPPVDVEPEGEFQLLPRTTPRHGGSVLMAAMLGLADALGFESHRQQTEMVQPADPANGPELDLSFGDLPPLN